MYSDRCTRALPRVGFPIRTSRDQRLVSTYSGLFAAAHVLLRLLAPRHPPCALILLINEEHRVCRYGVFKVRAANPPLSSRHVGRSLKTQQHSRRRGRRCSRRAAWPDGDDSAINGGGACRIWISGIPRKEVIQPQLPLRLPCYDFTPITNPTFDGSLPCGLGHRLRVLPAFVV